MIFKEIKGDLFESDDKYTLVHCISADCDMGKGIAKTFDSKMPQMKKLLKSTIRENWIIWIKNMTKKNLISVQDLMLLKRRENKKSQDTIQL